MTRLQRTPARLPHPIMLVPLLLVAGAAGVSPAFAQGKTADPLDAALESVATFEYGKDAGPLALVEKVVLQAGDDREERGAIEERLLAALDAARTRAATEFLCRQLRTIATDRSIPRLEAMLTDPETAHPGRYALECIEGPAASAALRRALARTSGPLRVGVLGSLGRRRVGEAVAEIAPLLRSDDGDVAVAAAAALGSIGGSAAVDALRAARVGATGALGVEIDDALLAAAERLVAGGRREQAARIYESLDAEGQARHLRIAALRGLVSAQGAGATARILEAIRSPDRERRASAIGLSVGLGGPDATSSLASLVPALPSDGQVLLLRALAARGDGDAIPAVEAAAESGNEDVRTAAYEALGELGGEAVVARLIRVAASTGGREQAVARASLLRPVGEGADRVLLHIAAGATTAERVEAIRALAGRGVTGVVKDLLGLAREDDAEVRRAAIEALGELVSTGDLPGLLGLFAGVKESADRGVLEISAVRALRRVKSPERRAASVLLALDIAPARARAALVGLLGEAPTPKTLEAVRRALEDPREDVRSAALETLAGWPDAAPAGELLELVGTLAGADRRALALRGYIRMAGQSADPLAMYRRALDLAEKASDRRLVLQGLGGVGSPEALGLVEAYLGSEDPELRAEAARAVVGIADRLRDRDAARARAALERVLDAAVTEGTSARAREVLNAIEQYEGYILTWLVSGPHKKKGMESRELFDAVLPPESEAAGDGAWKPLRRGLGSWDINLEAALGSLDHSAAYLTTRIWSPTAQAARLELGSDDAIKAWLNSDLVHAHYTHRGLSPRQDIAAVTLREGWNTLLLKVVDHEGGWAFCCRVRAPDGSALEGLRVEIQ